MKLVLIRHAKTILDRTRPNPLWVLSEEGILLANKLSEEELVKTLDVVYSSLQLKALETALLLAKPNGIPIKTNPDLAEISSFTREILGSERYEVEVRDFYEGRIERIAGGETAKEALQRFNKAIRQIIEVEKNEGNSNIGAVSHGNIFSFFSSQFCDKTPFELHQIIQPPDIAVLDWETKKFISFYGDHI